MPSKKEVSLIVTAMASHAMEEMAKRKTKTPPTIEIIKKLKKDFNVVVDHANKALIQENPEPRLLVDQVEEKLVELVRKTLTDYNRDLWRELDLRYDPKEMHGYFIDAISNFYTEFYSRKRSLDQRVELALRILADVEMVYAAWLMGNADDEMLIRATAILVVATLAYRYNNVNYLLKLHDEVMRELLDEIMMRMIEEARAKA